VLGELGCKKATTFNAASGARFNTCAREVGRSADINPPDA
jgi:hypothetical protein